MAKALHNIKQGFQPHPESGYSTKAVFWLTDPDDVETRIQITDDEAQRLIALDPYYVEEGDEDEPDDGEVSEPL